MLLEEQMAAWFEDPAHLAQHRLRVGQRVEEVPDDDRVERIVVEGARGGVAHDESPLDRRRTFAHSLEHAAGRSTQIIWIFRYLRYSAHHFQAQILIF